MNGTGRLCICRRLRTAFARGLARVMSIRSFHAGFHVLRLLACRLLKLNSNTPGTASYKIDVARVSSARRAVPASAPPQADDRRGCAARCKAFLAIATRG